MSLIACVEHRIFKTLQYITIEFRKSQDMRSMYKTQLCFYTVAKNNWKLQLQKNIICKNQNIKYVGINGTKHNARPIY
jgi:hypothetical protein